MSVTGWANELCAGAAHSLTDWASFSVSVDATDEGIANVSEVVEAVYAYLGMMRAEGAQVSE